MAEKTLEDVCNILSEAIEIPSMVIKRVNIHSSKVL
jgi:hypothetical protein